MAKKIIILNGSPRANGNTSTLTAEFKRGAEEAGNEVTEFHLSRMKINGCLGCWHGGGGRGLRGKRALVRPSGAAHRREKPRQDPLRLCDAAGRYRWEKGTARGV